MLARLYLEIVIRAKASPCSLVESRVKEERAEEPKTLTAPQLVQYQGSKRKLAPQILAYIQEGTGRLVEPFCGMGAVSIAAAQAGLAQSFWLNDLNEPLLRTLELAVQNPEQLASDYKAIWDAQFLEGTDSSSHFYAVRERYNSGDKSAAVTLYLLARCVKGAVRYKSDGSFNQSVDKRRNGTNPKRILSNASAISKLLRDRCVFTALDYRQLAASLSPGDLVYMDPPYQGVSNVRDHRYIGGVCFDELVAFLEDLNRRDVDFILSYDGACGEKSYGKNIPARLGCRRLLLDAGRSTQATLLGRAEATREALYLSPGLGERHSSLSSMSTAA